MKAVVYVLIVMVYQFSIAQYTNTEVVAKIKTTTIDDSVMVIGTAINTTEVYKSLTYVLSVFKTDNNANISKNKQEGKFTLGVILTGIVLDETKTKPGRDFYDYFYNSYTLNQIIGNKVVGVYETLSFGRSTIIQIKIEDVIVHEFLGKPDLEYLDHMSKVSIRKVYKYFKDLKKQKHAIFQY